MNIVSNEFFIEDYKICPRAAVFSTNRNSTNSIRLVRNAPNPYQFTLKVLHKAFIGVVKQLKKNKTISKKEIEDIFFLSKAIEEKKLNEKLFSKIKQRDYTAVLTKALENFFEFIKTVNIEKLILEEGEAEFGKKIIFDMVNFFYGEISLENRYKTSIFIPAIFNEMGQYTVLLIYCRDDKKYYMEAYEKINLVYSLFVFSSIDIKKIIVVNAMNNSKKTFYKPFIDNEVFLYDLKSILKSIDNKTILRQFDKKNCSVCNFTKECYITPFELMYRGRHNDKKRFFNKNVSNSIKKAIANKIMLREFEKGSDIF